VKESTQQEPLYRVYFIQNDKTYEVYARFLTEESLMGFIEIEELIFQDAKSGIVIDPTEEKMRAEFKGVKRVYLPLHSVLRIDEMVMQEGVACMSVSEKKNNVSQLPIKK